MTMPLEAIVPTNLGDTAYEKIADAVIAGHFAPGEKLTIRGLAESLGTSSTPVRDAVRRLIAQRALEQPSLRDIRVPVVSAADYREIATIRVEIEGLGASVAATRADAEGIGTLAGIVARNEDAIARADWPLATQLNRDFHFALAEMAMMPTLSDILAGLWLRCGPPVAVHYPKGGRDMIENHHAVLAALEARDPQAARAAIAADIGGVVEDIAALLDRPQDAPQAAPVTPIRPRNPA